MGRTLQIQPRAWLDRPFDGMARRGEQQIDRLRLLISEDGDEELILFVNYHWVFVPSARLLVTEKSVCVQPVPLSCVVQGV
jgi:hypothetical protein